MPDRGVVRDYAEDGARYRAAWFVRRLVEVADLVFAYGCCDRLGLRSGFVDYVEEARFLGGLSVRALDDGLAFPNCNGFLSPIIAKTIFAALKPRGNSQSLLSRNKRLFLICILCLGVVLVDLNGLFLIEGDGIINSSSIIVLILLIYTILCFL